MQRTAVRSRTARVLLGVILVGFAVQLALSMIWREPYPGLFQPSFGGAVDPAGTEVVEEPTVTVEYTDKTRAVVSQLQVMAQSQSLPSAVFKEDFGPESPRRSAPDTIAWLGRRLSDIGGGRQPERAVIEWRDVTYHLTDGRPPDSTVTDRLVITFGAEHG
jgi:hypothetical protein